MTTSSITRVPGDRRRLTHPRPAPRPAFAVGTLRRRPEPVERLTLPGADFSCGDYLKYLEQD